MLTIALLGAVACFVWMISGREPHQFLHTVGDAGEVLYDHIGWSLGVYITALLAFYGVSYGGQRFSSREDGRTVRRTLGVSAELLLSAALILVAFVAVYCSRDPGKSAVYVVLLPVIGIIAALALYLGGFVVAGPEARLANAEEDLRQLHMLKSGVDVHSGRKSFWVYVVNIAVVTVIGLLSELPAAFAGQFGPPLLSACIYAGTALVLAISLTLANYARLTSPVVILRIVPWILPVFVYGLAVYLSWTQVTSAASVWEGVALIVVTVAVTVVSVWPRNHARRWWIEWSISGANARIAHRSLVKWIEQTELTINELKPAPPRPKSGIVKRVLVALRPQ